MPYRIAKVVRGEVDALEVMYRQRAQAVGRQVSDELAIGVDDGKGAHLEEVIYHLRHAVISGDRLDLALGLRLKSRLER
jgi:hypothetical protein